MKEFRDFESAREFARALNLKSQKDWFKYSKSGNKPDDIPRSVFNVYKIEWQGWGDFLGTGNIAPKDMLFRPYKEAREFASSLNLKSQKDWFKYHKSGNKPDDIPSNPVETYKNKGWTTWGYWLGSGIISNKDKVFRSFAEAREFTRKLNLKNFTEWQDYCKSGNKPDDIPSTPNGTYKNKGWKSMGDWLGTGNVAAKNKTYLPFAEAREFVRKLNLKNFTEWQDYCKSGNKPDDIPSNPSRTYKNDEYVDLGNWLGTGYVASQKRIYRNFTEAKEFVRSLGLKNHEEWREYCASGNKPDDIPKNPWDVYKEWNIKRREGKK
jgi:hypothetical protein